MQMHVDQSRHGRTTPMRGPFPKPTAAPTMPRGFRGLPLFFFLFGGVILSFIVTWLFLCTVKGPRFSQLKSLFKIMNHEPIFSVNTPLITFENVCLDLTKIMQSMSQPLTRKRRKDLNVQRVCVCVRACARVPFPLLFTVAWLLECFTTHSRLTLTCADPSGSDSPVQTCLLGKYQINTDWLQICINALSSATTLYTHE